jgi:excisionase family DNA binding protein
MGSGARPFTLHEAAVRLERSEYWIRELVRRGRIPAWREGGRILLDSKDIEAYAQVIAARRLPSAPEKEWATEHLVVSALVRHLRRDGWRVVKRADPRTREHGVDLIVERDGILRAIEAKGFPAAFYPEGHAKAGQRRSWRSTQARTYMGDLLLTTLLVQDKYPDHEVAIAVPERLTFSSLVERLKPALRRLDIGAYIVHENGQVTEALAPRSGPRPSSRAGAAVRG